VNGMNTKRDADLNDILAMADDAYVMGMYLSDMLAKGPSIEENVALASLGQDEIGHAVLLYRYLANQPEVHWETEDDFAYQRPIADFRSAKLVESDSKDWADIVITNYLYKTAQTYFLDKWLQQADAEEEAAGILRRITQEKSYHMRHWQIWVTRLSNTTIGRPRMQKALEEKWPYALHCFDGTSLAGDANWPKLLAAKVAEIPLSVPPVSGDPQTHGRGSHFDCLVRVIETSRELVNAGIGTKW